MKNLSTGISETLSRKRNKAARAHKKRSSNGGSVKSVQYLLCNVTPALLVEYKGPAFVIDDERKVARSPSTVVRYRAVLSHAFVVASPDGFGFENSRIVGEVKHRTGAMGSEEVRSFLGGRHKDDRGLFVSTGGFPRDAYYEAERASITLTLWDLSDLVRALIENIEKLRGRKAIGPTQKAVLARAVDGEHDSRFSLLR